jgi:hypothetical protein
LADESEALWENLLPVPLFPPGNPHELTWGRNRVTTVGSRSLTAWTVPRPLQAWFSNSGMFWVAFRCVFQVLWYFTFNLCDVRLQ